jgi:hypothetical protein
MENKDYFKKSDWISRSSIVRTSLQQQKTVMMFRFGRNEHRFDKKHAQTSSHWKFWNRVSITTQYRNE